VWTGLVVHHHRDGHEIFIESAVRYLRDQDGIIFGLVGINRDVTARESALLRERTAQERLALLARASTELTASLDVEARLETIARQMAASLADWCAVELVAPDGTLQRVAVASADPAQQSLADELRQYTAQSDGSSSTAAVLRTGQAILLPAISDAVLIAGAPQPHYQEILRAIGATSGMVVPLIARRQSIGIILCMRTGARAPFTPDDLALAEELAQRAATAVDNARLYAAAQAAAEQKDAALARLDTILTLATIGVAFFDTALRFVHVNATMASMTGRPVADHIGQAVHVIIPRLGNAQQALLEQVLATGQPIIDREIIVPEGWLARPGTYLISYYPVNTGAGVPIGVGVVVVDITERRTLEQQLIQAQKMESIGRLAGGVAHDFNNLLTVIGGGTELARDLLPADHPAQVDLAQVNDASRRAAVLTRQLLAFARKQHLDPRVLQLNDRIHHTEQLLRRLIGEDINLQVTLAPDLPLVSIDAQQIEQVLVNLAINARDAMPAGGTLIIETSSVTVDGPSLHPQVKLSPGEYVRVAVTDTGIGMPPEVRERVFEPFFTTKGPDKGSGLGLAMCYGIIKQHGGYIWVYSEVDRGTTVSVYLPVAASDEADDAISPATAPPLVGGTETVLLVEDELAVRELTARVLRDLGYRVLEAERGEVALALAATTSIDLLLTDVVMPKMSGIALTNQIQQRWPGVKVVYMSGYAARASLEHEHLPAGAPLLQKPFGRSDLSRAVRAALDG
jgi:two-component system cell cycle sensor histidine kinase/response regulator CckA